LQCLRLKPANRGIGNWCECNGGACYKPAPKTDCHPPSDHKIKCPPWFTFVGIFYYSSQILEDLREYMYESIEEILFGLEYNSGARVWPSPVNVNQIFWKKKSLSTFRNLKFLPIVLIMKAIPWCNSFTKAEPANGMVGLRTMFGSGRPDENN
jgi:hypothetical protein